MRAAASRTFWTAGRSRPIRMAMIPITAGSSISVKPRRDARMVVLRAGKSALGRLGMGREIRGVVGAAGRAGEEGLLLDQGQRLLTEDLLPGLAADLAVAPLPVGA